MKLSYFSLVVFLLIQGPLFLEAQQNEPVYLNNPIIGPYISEFAINSPNKELIQELEPYIRNGRLYFCGIGLPLSTGNLKPDFEFNLDFYENTPRIKALYRGSSRKMITEEAKSGILVAGYAERGSIIITQAFFSEEEASKWAQTIRFAF